MSAKTCFVCHRTRIFLHEYLLQRDYPELKILSEKKKKKNGMRIDHLNCISGRLVFETVIIVSFFVTFERHFIGSF